MDDVLPDVLATNLKVVFCGTAASTKSAQVGAYYAGPGNRFWPTLYGTRLTAVQLQPQQFREVLQHGIGLTDVAKRASGMDSALTSSDFDAKLLLQKIHHYYPHIVAFTSKRAAREALNMSSTAKLHYGWLDQTIGETRLYVLPSPSSAARGYWDISYWQALADAVREPTA